jgi:hypothetical protein
MVIELAEIGADQERLEQQTSSLRWELLELDVGYVVRGREGVAPEGARGLDLVAVGELLVSLQGSFEIVKPVVDTVRAWVARGRSGQNRTAELTVGDKTIKLTGVSTDQQDRLIEQFVAALLKK